jgi:hypothetical protein
MRISPPRVTHFGDLHDVQPTSALLTRHWRVGVRFVQ